MSLSTKTVVALLTLIVASTVMAAPIGDLRAPLVIKSRFVVRAEEGPPADRNGLSRYASCYLLKFSAIKYRRDISFSPTGDYIYLHDFYGDYQLPGFQIQKVSNFVSYRSQYSLNNSWQGDLKQGLGKGTRDDGKSAVQIDLPQLPDVVKGIVGEGRSNIKVTGNRSISFSGRSEWEDNLVNTGTFKQSKFPTLQMEQKSRFKVTGTIGSKITVEVDQDSQRDTDLANTIKLRYKGDEDEILQSIEAGNTNLALPNSQFIGYSQNVQGLFGIKATAKVGNLDLTIITSQEKGASEKANFNAGAKGSERQIRDYDYLANTYFWLGVDHGALDSLVSVELYTTGHPPADPHGLAVVTPLDSLPYISPEENTRGEFKYTTFTRLEQFDLRSLGWYVVLNKPLTEGEILGAYIKYARYYQGSSRIDTIKIGNLNYRPSDTSSTDTTYVLKLLKHNNPSASFSTWNLMWRNVYDLGSRNISPDGFVLKIYLGNGSNQITEPEDQNGRCFISLLGLDKKNNTTQAPGADCIFDFDNTMIDAPRGHLIFPELFPFRSDSLTVKVDSIYSLQSNSQQLRNLTKYYIYVKSAQRSSSFSLGRANIMPNSEVVKLGDGTILRRDIDYTINYDIGQITFLTDQALNPAANVTVDFEYAPFFSPEKKSLFGVAGQYKFWENSNISMAAMYRSESASDPRPRVGREPRRGFIWDSNFSFNFKPDIMTNMIDALPLVEADAPSALEITGEVAQSFPNPNTKNEAYLDDFEGTRNYNDLGARRGIWTKSSPPVDSSNARLPLSKRSAIWWYNPINQFRIREIWPNRSVKTQDDRLDVMFLRYFPDTTAAAPESSWAGIMRPFYVGLADQTLTKYIEIWYYPGGIDTGGDPTLNLDFGAISEDINDDGIWNSEDRQTPGTAIGVFEPDQEDTGLDGLFDPQEPGYNSQANHDPNGDDWRYDSNSNDFSHINGTEGNREDSDRRGRFDTEDINNNSGLDNQNGYFEYSVHMNNPRYLVDSTTTGWKLLRIPFQDSTFYKVFGDAEQANFSRINSVRLWFSGARQPYQMVIASLELVGNKWQELAIAYPQGDTLRPDEKFEVSVKNSQENSNYTSPPGIEGHLDRETGIREKEQSLVLAYQNMPANHTGGAYWSMYSPEDYTQYQKLRMYVHGDTTVESGVADRQLTFFLRLSQDGKNFYEYHTVLEPGWSENNWVNIDFEKLTALKYELQKATPPESLNVADTTDGNYRIYGNPSLSQVKFFIVGVEVAGDAPSIYTGEVWLDEMRVTEVRRKSDFAGRIQASARFSDFFDVNITYNRTGADFFPLAARAPAGATNISKSARLNLKTDKILPPSFGLSLPVSISWQNTLALPRLKPGSDIILAPSAREVEKTQNSSYNYTISQSFSRNTKNWLWNLTFNRIRTSYMRSHTAGISPASPISRIDNYKGTGGYDLTPKSKPSFKMLAWSKYIFLPKNFYNAECYFLPTQLNFSGEINSNKSMNVNQRGISTSIWTRGLSLSGSTALAPFSSLRTAYNLSSLRDITQPGRFKLSINPSKLKLGRQQTFQQRFETVFQPKLIQLIDTRFSFNSSYSENSDIKRYPDSTRGTDMTATFKLEPTFNIQNLFSSRGGGNRPPPSRKRDNESSNKPNDITPGNEVKKDSLEKGQDESPRGMAAGSPRWVFRQFKSIMKSVKPIRGSYLKDKRLGRQGLVDQPRWQYMFGFSEKPGVSAKYSTGLGGLNQTVYSNNYELDSGLQPGHGIDVNSGYSQRRTITRSTTEPISAKSVTFPDISINLSGLEKLSVFKKVSNSVGLQSSYSKKVDENGNADTGALYKRDTAKQWAPLLSLNINFLNNIRATVRYDLSRNISKNLRGEGQARRDTYGSDNTFKLSLSYSLSAPKGLKLPILKRIKFNSQLSLNFDITVRKSKSESISGGVKSIDSQRGQLIIEPRLTYQFSRAITGGIRGRWDDSNDKIQKRKHHIRELGITAEIRF